MSHSTLHGFHYSVHCNKINHQQEVFHKHIKDAAFFFSKILAPQGSEQNKIINFEPASVHERQKTFL